MRSRGRHFSPSLPGHRYLKLGSKSDLRAEFSGSIVRYDALAPRPEVLLLRYFVGACAATVKLKLLPYSWEKYPHRVSFQTSPGKNAYFEPIYYWSFTMFRCSGRTPVNGNTAMYLGCNQSDNRAVLVQVKEPYDLPGYYPDPRILFIASRA